MSSPFNKFLKQPKSPSPHLFRQHQLLRLQRLPLRLLRLARRLRGGQAPRQRRRGSAQAPLLRRSAARQGRLALLRQALQAELLGLEDVAISGDFQRLGWIKTCRNCYEYP